MAHHIRTHPPARFPNDQAIYELLEVSKERPRKERTCLKFLWETTRPAKYSRQFELLVHFDRLNVSNISLSEIRQYVFFSNDMTWAATSAHTVFI